MEGRKTMEQQAPFSFIALNREVAEGVSLLHPRKHAIVLGMRISSGPGPVLLFLLICLLGALAGCDLFSVSLADYLKESPEILYSITIKPASGGAVSASRTSAAAGTAVRLTAAPEGGYQLAPSALKVNGGEVALSWNAPSYRFTMPASDVTVEAFFGPGTAEAYRPAGNGGLGEYYSLLSTAMGFSPLPGDAANPDLIDILADINVTAGFTLYASRHIALNAAAAKTIKRTSGYSGTLFLVKSAASLTLRGMGADSLVIDGGALWWGGSPADGAVNISGVTAEEPLIIVDAPAGKLRIESGVVLQNNEIPEKIGYDGGGAVYNKGRVEISGGKISNNRVGKTTGGSTELYGGALKNDHGEITITGGEISGNHAATSSTGGGRGGAIINNGTLTIRGGVISGNKADLWGGGIASEHDNANFTMEYGTISGNSAGKSLANGLGGGVYVNNTSRFTMKGGTISGNEALLAAGKGGGVYVDNGGTFILERGTVYGNDVEASKQNTAGGGASLFVAAGGEARYDSISGPLIIPSNSGCDPSLYR
jgi:hypothetical protein